MAERTLRGARLGGQSFEDERGIEFAARQQVGYRCPRGTSSRSRCRSRPTSPRPGSASAAAPRRCSVAGIEPEVKVEKPARTHWDMLLERRSEKELEDILKERLELLRGGEIGPAHLHRASAQEEGQLSARRAPAQSSTTSPWTTDPPRSGSGARRISGQLAAAQQRRPITRVSSRRATGRVNGRISRMPNGVGDEPRREHAACRRPGSARRRPARGPASGRS